MTLSICIPQYNRIALLVEVLKSITVQNDGDFEVIIFDDGSTDDSDITLRHFIAEYQGMIRFKYLRQEKNVGYDRNLRSAMNAATGEYLMILGNDDALADPGVVGRLRTALDHLKPTVALVNQCTFSNRSDVYKRATSTALLGSGPDVAIQYFRRFSVVCGLIFKTSVVHELDTNEYDGSIFYQIYLACAAIAGGGVLASIDDVIVAKDVVSSGIKANSYRDILRAHNQVLKMNTGGLDAVGRVACAGIQKRSKKSSFSSQEVAIFKQLLRYSYPYWLMDYRQHGVFRASVNLALGCRPSNLTKQQQSSLGTKLRLVPTYLAATAVGLLLPVKILASLATAIRNRS